MGTLKYSRQREAIQNFLLSRKDHPTAEMIYENVRKEYPNLSLGTVYRNLSLLSDLGRVKRITAGDGRDHFDGFVHPHDHFICRCCGSVSDIEFNTNTGIERSVGKHFDGRIDSHTTIFYGTCRNCLDAGSAS